MSATLISIIVSLLFVLILITGFLIGMWRGLKRSMVNMVLSLIGVVVAFFVTPIVTNAIVGINITIDGQKMPIQEIALYFFNQDHDLSLLVNTNANLKTLVLNLPSAIINAVLFMVMTIAVECVLYLVYKLLAGLVFKYKTGQKRKRIWGGVIGLVKTLIISLFVFMPLSSLIGLAQSMVGEVSAQEQVAEADEGQVKTQTLLGSSLSPTVIQIINGLNNSAWVQICGVGGMDDGIFDYYANVEIEGEKVLIIEEVSNIFQTADSVYQVQQIINNNASLSSIDYDELSKVVDEFVDSKLYKLVLTDSLGEILVNYEDYSFMTAIVGENEEIFQNIADALTKEKAERGSYDAYFTNDIKLLVDIFRTLGENGVIDDIVALEDPSAENIINLLTGEKHGQNFAGCIAKVFNMNLVRASSEEIAQMAVKELIPDEQINAGTSAWTDVEWAEEANKINQAFDCIGEILTQAPILDVLQDFTMLLDKDANYDVNKLLSSMGKVIDTILDVKLFTNAEGESVFAGYLENLGLTLPTEAEKVYNNEGEEVTISNYQQMLEFIAPSVKAIKDEGIYDLLKDESLDLGAVADLLSQEGNEDLLSEILLPLYQIDLTKDIANSLLNLSGFDFEDQKAEIGYFSTLLVTLNSKNVGSTSTTYLDLILSGEIDQLFEEIRPEEIYSTLEPIFKMKSDYGVDFKISLVDQIKSAHETEIASIPVLCQNAQILGIDEETKNRYQSYYDNLVGKNYQEKGNLAYNDLDYENMFTDFTEMAHLKNQFPSV